MGIVHLASGFKETLSNVDIPHPIESGSERTHFLSIQEFSCESRIQVFQQPIDADGMKDAVRHAVLSNCDSLVCLHSRGHLFS